MVLMKSFQLLHLLKLLSYLFLPAKAAGKVRFDFLSPEKIIFLFMPPDKRKNFLLQKLHSIPEIAHSHHMFEYHR